MSAATINLSFHDHQHGLMKSALTLARFASVLNVITPQLVTRYVHKKPDPCLNAIGEPDLLMTQVINLRELMHSGADIRDINQSGADRCACATHQHACLIDIGIICRTVRRLFLATDPSNDKMSSFF